MNGFVPAEAILDMARLSRKAADVVKACCTQLGISSREWSSALGGEAGNAAVVVSGLRWGERDLPPELLADAGSTRRAPLLLLCAEPLTSPAVQLYEGLVTLTGTPLSPDRLLGELRIALSRTLGEQLKLPVPSGVELLVHHSWSACVGGEGSRLPLLREDQDRLTALVTFEQSDDWDADSLANVSAALQSDAGPDAIAEALRDRAGLVRLDSANREWLLYWPSATAPLYFHSPGRLPRTVDLRSPTKGPVRPQRLSAARGDALVCLSTASPAGFPETHVLQGGAPGFLHRAAPALTALGAAWSCFCVEARA